MCRSIKDCTLFCSINTSMEDYFYPFFLEGTTKYIIPKHPLDTRWSTRADATEAMFQGSSIALWKKLHSMTTRTAIREPRQTL